MIAEQKFDKEKPPILVCKADGNPKPTVVWYKDDEQVTSKSGEISADRFTLRVKSPDAKSKLTYSCFVSNKYGNLSYEFVIEVPGNYVFNGIPSYSVSTSDSLNQILCYSYYHCYCYCYTATATTTTIPQELLVYSS